MRLWDISPPVHEGSPVFPGDTAYQQRWSTTLGPRSPVNVSAITTTPHVGAHADAPLHYDAKGDAIGAVALEPYLGRCRVIHAWGFQGPGSRSTQKLLRWAHIEHAVDRNLPPRVLLRTYERAPTTRFDNNLPSFAPETIERLADLGVKLVGIDSASVDPADSKTLDSHQVLRRRGLRVLENLVLDDVPEGDYELIALPLKLMRADASPVRAILREWPSDRPTTTQAAALHSTHDGDTEPVSLQ